MRNAGLSFLRTAGGGESGAEILPSWFKKVFKGDVAKLKANQARPIAHAPTLENPALGRPAVASAPAPGARKVVQAPLLVPEVERSSWSEDIRIKAQVDSDRTSCVFMVDRPVLDGLSAWFPEAIWAEELSPLAVRLFSIDGVDTVLLHDTTVTLTARVHHLEDWEALAREAGTAIREHLKTGEPVAVPAFVDAMPPEDEIRRRVQACVDLEINPGIAAHSGVVTLERVRGNTVYITMGGGCQGCAASAITLRQGIHTAFRQAVPQIGAIYDETDHTAGTNPYFSELPAGMS